ICLHGAAAVASSSSFLTREGCFLKCAAPACTPASALRSGAVHEDRPSHPPSRSSLSGGRRSTRHGSAHREAVLEPTRVFQCFFTLAPGLGGAGLAGCLPGVAQGWDPARKKRPFRSALLVWPLRAEPRDGALVRRD